MDVVERMGPVVVLRCPPRMDQAFVADLARGFEVQLSGTERYSVVVDTSVIAHLPGANERRALAAWMNDPKNKERERKLCVGAATVVTNAAMRGVLTALYWIWTPPVPQHACEDADAGVTWSFSQLEKAGLPVPPERQAEIRRWLAGHPSTRLRSQG